jgi:gluconolactonase
MPYALAMALLSSLGGCGGGDAPEADEPSSELSTPGAPRATAAGAGTILRLDPRFSSLVPPGARIEQIAGGFVFTEGPLWDSDASRLLFSDVAGNVLYQWTEADSVSAVISDYFSGTTEGRQFFGPNGLTRDAEGRIVIADQGARQITRLEADGSRTTLVDSYEGARLNSPNDLVFHPGGSLFFTDPPYGLVGLADSPLQELEFSGIYRLSPDGALELLAEDQPLPNGLGFSPDGRVLYVANSDPARWMAYDVAPVGGNGPSTVSNPRVFVDAAGDPAAGGADGLKVDLAGNLFATGPGGVWVIAPDGTHLGTISPTEAPSNVAWGEDGRTLYMTAVTGVYRIRLTAEGAIP